MKRLFFISFLLHPQISLAVSNDTAKHLNWQLLNSNECGQSNADRIVGGVEAPIGAYPWLARIGYIPKGQIIRSKSPIYECGGAVVNKFYVITAAHCSARLPNNLEVSRVRLGEHDTRTNPDCENSFCNDPYKDYDVSEVIVHAEYDWSKVRNDIALLRVDKEIEFTHFVKPICMLKGKLLEKSFVHEMAEVAGWGLIDSLTQKRSEVLQVLKVPIRPNDLCRLNTDYRKYSIDFRQLCAGGIPGQDSCSGDSGGPLMKVVDDDEGGSQPRYFIIGLVSFGLTHCGGSETPGVYTDVAKYMPWILEHIRA